MSTAKKQPTGKLAAKKSPAGRSTAKKATGKPSGKQTAGKRRAPAPRVKPLSPEQRRQAEWQGQALKHGLHLMVEGPADDAKWTWFCQSTGRQILTARAKTLRYVSPLDSGKLKSWREAPGLARRVAETLRRKANA